MSRFLSTGAAGLAPYVPGEQPQDGRYIKLNTNESPYPPGPAVEKTLAKEDAGDLRLYPDPDVGQLRSAMARYYGLTEKQVFVGSGSDEVLGYAFMAFFDPGDPVYYADITYGFYKVYAKLCGLAPEEIPLREDFTLDIADYMDKKGHVIIANPNAPTGTSLERDVLEALIAKDPNRLVIVDEAYIDFAGDKSCVPLIDKYDNLLVVQTFSKSRSLAGMRIGCGLGHTGLIAGLDRIKYSFNPYNMNRPSIAAGVASLEDDKYFRSTVGMITSTRDRVAGQLGEMGFTVLPSETNFLFVKHPVFSGEELYQKLRDNGVLVRYFDKDRIRDYVRVSIGTDGEMDRFIKVLGRLA